MNATADFYSKPSGLSAYPIYGRTKGVKQFGGIESVENPLHVLKTLQKMGKQALPGMKLMNPFRGVNGTSFLEELF